MPRGGARRRAVGEPIDGPLLGRLKHPVSSEVPKGAYKMECLPE